MAKTRRKARRSTTKRQLALAIEKGLMHVTENHDIFIGRGRYETFCGCALVIAEAGLWELFESGELDEEKFRATATALEIEETRLDEQGKDPIALLAQSLGISYELAHKIDVLHRQKRINALEIAAMLRKGLV